jgi:predicted nucleic acid-binding protein
MKCRAFLDTNVFIYAFEFPESNSNRIIGLLNKSEIEAVISERVLKEVQVYFKKFYSKDLASLFRDYLLRTCIIVFSADVTKEITQFRRLIKEKDLEQVAVVKKMGIKYLISYDRDFGKVAEHVTPKAFLKELGISPVPSTY